MNTAPAAGSPNWDAENKEQWETQGRTIARRNLNWSIFAEFLGFVVWQLWSIVVVQLPAAGFTFTTSEIFWLISMPSLVGAPLRIPYTFMVPRFGGRNWTIVSALLLLIPSIGLALCVSNPETPFGVMLFVAALAGFGGGNFASSMANITFFYPAREKAAGADGAGGNLGAAVAQLAVPIAITLLAAGTVNLPMAGWMSVPFILIAAFGAWKYMDNLTSAKGDVAGSLAALKEPHLWIMALLYIGTFGSSSSASPVSSLSSSRTTSRRSPPSESAPWPCPWPSWARWSARWPAPTADAWRTAWAAPRTSSSPPSPRWPSSP